MSVAGFQSVVSASAVNPTTTGLRVIARDGTVLLDLSGTKFPVGPSAIATQTNLQTALQAVVDGTIYVHIFSLSPLDYVLLHLHNGGTPPANWWAL